MSGVKKKTQKALFMRPCLMIMRLFGTDANDLMRLHKTGSRIRLDFIRLLGFIRLLCTYARNLYASALNRRINFRADTTPP